MKRLWLAKYGYGIISCVFLVLAILFMAVAQPPQSPVCWTISLTVMAYGAVRVVGFYAKDLYCLAFQYDLALGILLALSGVVLLVGQDRIYPYLLPAFGWLVLIDSLFRIQTSQEARRFGLPTWYVILITAVVAGVLSALLIFLWKTPSGRFLAGCALLAESAMNFCVLKLTVKSSQRVQENQ